MSPLQLLPLLVILLIPAANARTTPASVAAAVAPAAAPGCGPSAPPAPVPWPEQFHAVVITNQTARGGRLQRIDIYYDWPRGRALNIIRDQLDGGSGGEAPLRDVQWTNGTSFVFDSASCTVFQYPVGLLPPDWKSARGGGAAFLSTARVDGFDCHVWSNFVFARYYEDAATGRPVSWTVVNGTGQRHVLSFEVGGVSLDSTKWQAPPYCFNANRADGGAAASP